MEKEIRSIKAEFRYNEEQGRTISGYAVRYNETSRYIGWYEVIAPGAITQEVINRSDIFMTYNHATDNFLARSRNGEGTLKLEVREDGIYFEFECPDTAFGNDVLTKIKRGELDECSFAFTISADDDAELWERNGEELHRTIYKIDRLYDCAICPVGAYSTTSVTARSQEMIEKLEKDTENKVTILDIESKKDNTILNNMDNVDKMILRSQEEELEKEEQKELQEEQKPEEEQKNDEQTEAEDDNKEEKSAEDETKEEEKSEDEQSDDETIKEDEQKEEDDPKDETKEEKSFKSIDNNKNTNTNHNIMKEQFSLIKAIRNVIDKKAQDEVSAAVISAGKNELRKSGANFGKADIAIPMEVRTVQVTGENGTHDAVIDTDFTAIQEPLKNKNILSDLGVNVLTGLVNDLQIPYGSAITSNWVGETSTASPADATFTYKVMKPKRLATVVKVSMQQLRQDSIGVEAFLRKQIVESIQDKLEATVFGSDAATDLKPGGILAAGNATAGSEASNFAGITMNEALIEANNYNGTFKYAVTPKAKAALRALSYGGKSTAMVWQGNEIDGVPAITSNHVGNAGQYIVGDWSTVYVGQWGPVLLQVDDVTMADDGIVRLIINSFWDVCYTRPQALVTASVSLK